MRVLISLSATTVFAATLFAGCSSTQSENRSANKSARPTPNAATTPMVGPPTPAVGPPPAVGPVAAATPNDGVRRITPAELQAAIVKGEAVVVDVRNQASYQKGHIKDARLIPADQIAARASELPRDKMIVTYCA